ncbi:MAG: alpha/beta hydrolase [Cyclobacteriaceae bacterium]|nr:alpha/beta hydrolase [Cyclobacteriaceae bacterium]
MPIIETCYTKIPFYFRNSFVQTVVPSIFYSVAGIEYTRKRLELVDGDFLDLDWLKNKNERIIILSHGLEGDTQRHYIKRFAKYFYDQGWDILAWNYRSCSGEMNRLPKFYAYGDTQDLSAIVNHVLTFDYKRIVLAGFSMGGGLVAKFLGTTTVSKRITHGLTFSVSCDLKNSVEEVEKIINTLYKKVFINKLKNKLKLKAIHFKEFSSLPIEQVQSFANFHNLYSIPFHNYNSLEDFYAKSSSKPYYKNITVPTLMLNALDDPILGAKCYPYEEANKSSRLFLETPEYGGHIGFSIKGSKHSYMELRAEEFLNGLISAK